MNHQPKSVAPVDLPMVFILAKGRSGTTLLQTMLDAHPNVIAPLESRFAVHFWNRYGRTGRWTQRVKDRFIKDVLGEMKISLFWEMDIPSLEKRIESLSEDSSYGMVCKQVYASRVSLFEKESPSIIVDKNPIHALLIPLIKDVFPNARFIHVIRDYRANSSSFFKFQPHKSMRELGNMWNLYNARIDRLKRSIPDSFLTLYYENLVANPEMELRKITEFLGVPFHNKMIDYPSVIGPLYDSYVERSPSERVRKVRQLASKTVHKNLSKPLNTELLDTWKRNLTSEQITVLDTICAKYNDELRAGIQTASREPKIPLDIKLKAQKLLWYYQLPIWLRELKSKPNLALLPENDS